MRRALTLHFYEVIREQCLPRELTRKRPSCLKTYLKKWGMLVKVCVVTSPPLSRLPAIPVYCCAQDCRAGGLSTAEPELQRLTIERWPCDRVLGGEVVRCSPKQHSRMHVFAVSYVTTLEKKSVIVRRRDLAPQQGA